MNPFGSRNITRALIFCTVGILGMPLFIGPIIAFYLLFYWKQKTKKQGVVCSEIIQKKFGENVKFIEEVYHPKKEWGFLALTDNSVIFIPKSGDEIIIPLSNINNYGSKNIGTGEFVTTVSQLPGTKMNVGSTRENKVPVFHLELFNGEFQYWYVWRINPFFNALDISIGKPEVKKVNY